MAIGGRRFRGRFEAARTTPPAPGAAGAGRVSMVAWVRFGVGLVAWAVGLAADGVAQDAPSLPRSTAPLRLTGLLVDQQAPARSLCLIHCTDAPDRHGVFGAGERACDVALIREVRQEGVVIENLLTKQTEDLALLGAAVPPPPLPSAVTEPTPAVTVELPRTLLLQFLTNLPDLLTATFATPRYREMPDGQRVIDGYQIGVIKPGTLVEQLGLRNGDVVLELNGQTLDGLATVLRLFGEFISAPQATMTVLRDGQRMTLVLTTR